MVEKNIMWPTVLLHNEWLKIILWVLGNVLCLQHLVLLWILLELQLAWKIDAVIVNNHFWSFCAGLKRVAFTIVLVQRECWVVPVSLNKLGCWVFLFNLTHNTPFWCSIFLHIIYISSVILQGSLTICGELLKPNNV